MQEIEIPQSKFASAPAEERGISRDQSLLLVTNNKTGDISHTVFSEIGNYLDSGDLFIYNNSATNPVCFDLVTKDGQKYELRLSQKLLYKIWIVELNFLGKPVSEFESGEIILLPEETPCLLVSPFKYKYAKDSQLWIVSIRFNENYSNELNYLYKYAHPHHYYYHAAQWPIEDFQTVFSSAPGSAEMPCAGRGFTNQLLNKLQSHGIEFIPITLHCGTNSEGHVPPHAEYYDVSLTTSNAINQAIAEKRRIIAIGTTVVRALVTVTDKRGKLHPGSGWTQKVICPEDLVLNLSGMVTTLHQTKATHLDIIRKFISEELLETAYIQALKMDYLWHEFGDFHLLI